MDKFIKTITRQAKGYIEIVLLKLRIIGFSNKRSGLFTRLGETVYRSRGEREDVTPGSDMIRIIGDIENAEREIVEAENAINKCKIELEAEWAKYKAEREKAYDHDEESHEKPIENLAEKPDIIKLQPDEPDERASSDSDMQKSAS